MGLHFTITLCFVVFFSFEFNNLFILEVQGHTFSYSAPSFVIDLNKDPSERWKEVAEKYSANITKAIEACLLIATKRFKTDRANLMKNFESLAAEFETKSYLADYIAEVKVYHIDYVLKGTTAILLSKDSVVWTMKTIHLNATEAIRGIVINVDFKKDGKSIIKCTTLAGMVGIIFGSSVTHKLVMSYNRRVTKVTLMQRLQFGTALAKNKTSEAWPISYLIRHLLLNKDNRTFNDIAKYLEKEVHLTAPCIISMNGAFNTEENLKKKQVAQVIFRKNFPEKAGTDRAPTHIRIDSHIVFGSWDWTYPDNWPEYDIDETFCSTYVDHGRHILEWRLQSWRSLNGRIENPHKKRQFNFNISEKQMDSLAYLASQQNTVIYALNAPGIDFHSVKIVTNHSKLYLPDSRACSRGKISIGLFFFILATLPYQMHIFF